MNDTIIIFGTSPFISNFGDENINYLIDKYDSIGINSFGIRYNNIKYWIWADYNLYNYFKPHIKNHKLILSKSAYIKEASKYSDGLNIEYVFDGQSGEISHDLNSNKLLMFKTSAHPAINYAYLKGYKNIILCGVDLTCNWNHFDGDYKVQRTIKRIDEIRRRLYMFKDYINLYTLNEDSTLEINKINIKEL